MSLEDAARRLKRLRRGGADGAAAPVEARATAPSPVDGPGRAVSADAAPLSPDLVERLDEVRARQPALWAELARLNPYQQRAVLDVAETALVRARVGSGKTTVLVGKVLHLALIRGVPLGRMAVLTFTNQAAGEIRRRITELAQGMSFTPRDWRFVGTFHGVARALLAHVLPLDAIGRRPGFTILDGSERLEWLDGLIARHDLSIRYQRSLDRRIERRRVGGATFGTMKGDDDLARLLELFEDEKRRRNVVDFDDLIDFAERLLGAAAVVPPLDWIIVDELQDCDARQLELLTRLAGPNTRVFAVGDPQQVIYSWRGSRPDVFEELARRRAGAREYTLPLNYRSTATILDAAVSVLGHQGEALAGVREEGAKVRLQRHHDPTSEAGYYAHRIATAAERGVSPAGIAILYRTRDQGRPIREALIRAGLTYRDASPARLRDEPALRWLAAAFRAAANPLDLDAAVLALRDSRYGVLAKGWPSRRFTAARRSGAVASVHELVPFLEEALGRSARRDAAVSFARRLVTAREHFADGVESVDLLFEHFDLLRRFSPTSSRYDDDVAAARETLTRKLDVFEHGDALSYFAAEIVLGAREPSPTAADAVQLMTFHAAKGLEFDEVYVSGANVGLVPLTSSWGSAADEAEERRLFFVALSRARDRLEISWHGRPEHHAAVGEPSPFLAALPPSRVERVDDVREPVAAPAGRGTAPWPAGARVRHVQYGVGAIVRHEKGVVVCAFDRLGEKSFSEFFCPLEPA